VLPEPIDINTEEMSAAEEVKQEKQNLAKMLQRDSGCRTFARFLDTISVFMYQGTVFMAQWTIVTSETCF
jgi:hypothetical protein